MNLLVKALRVDKYMKTICNGHNCDFIYGEEVADKHTFLTIDEETGRKYSIEFTETEGECGSGWCPASWANMEVEEISNFRGYTHIPKKKLYFKNFNKNSDSIENEFINFSGDDYDSYHPSGYYEVNMDLFKANLRYKKDRPVWIFKGESASGKSFLASKMDDMNIFETDSECFLPDNISSDIIVLGNKYSYTIEEIKERIIGEYELYIVDFNKHK